MHRLETLTASVLDEVGRGAVADAVTLTFLLRRYAATDAADIRDVLGTALAAALDAPPAATIPERAAWLRLFAEAGALSDDERLFAAARSHVTALLEHLPSTALDGASEAIDACLTAALHGDPLDIIPTAIEQLEDLVARAYRPGQGMGGTTADDLTAASALLTAYGVTRRVPYAMLAEELVQTARRRAWNPHDGVFFAPDGVAALDMNCRAARVLVRLAAVHADVEYRDAAVVADEADYRRDAGRILSYFESVPAGTGAAAAEYGLALAEYLDLQ